MTDVVGVDVGGTTVTAARCASAAAGSADPPSALVERSTPGRPGAVVDAVMDLVSALRTPQTRAVGVVTPGTVDDGAGIVRFAANLGWRDLPLRSLLTRSLGLPVAIGHDVSAAAEAEAAHHPGTSPLLFVALGTGIAAAPVVDGRVQRGATGSAGELGHVVVRPDGEACPCGRRGCLERYASAAALPRRYRAAGGRGPVSDARELLAAVDTDPVAARIWADAIDALADAVATTVALLDPAVVVLGGGLAGAGERLTAPLAQRLTRALPWRDAPTVRVATLGTSAGWRGAARLAGQLVPAEEPVCA